MVSCSANTAKAATLQENNADILALLMTPGVGSVTVHRIRALAQAIEEPVGALLGLQEAALQRCLPPGASREARALARCSPLIRARAGRLLQETLHAGCIAIRRGEPLYPASLAHAGGGAAPQILFLKGNITLMQREAAGVVGTRTPSEAGLLAARHCAAFFAARGLPVVSGAAPGVDTAAHLAALEHRGTSIAVLPQGMLTYSPCREIEAGLSANRVLLLSEFEPSSPWQRHAAIARNATISALSKILCVIEPQKEGGSIQTARHSLCGGKPVFYLPRCGPIPQILAQSSAQPLQPTAGTFPFHLESALRHATPQQIGQGLLF